MDNMKVCEDTMRVTEEQHLQQVAIVHLTGTLLARLILSSSRQQPHKQENKS